MRHYSRGSAKAHRDKAPPREHPARAQCYRGDTGNALGFTASGSPFFGCGLTESSDFMYSTAAASSRNRLSSESSLLWARIQRSPSWYSFLA